MNESKLEMKLRLNEYLYQKWTDTEFSEEETFIRRRDRRMDTRLVSSKIFSATADMVS